MRGKVLELEVEIAEKRGYAQGVSEGKVEGISTGVLRGRVQALYADAGFSLEEIAEKVKISIEEVIQILQELKFLPPKGKSSAS